MNSGNRRDFLKSTASLMGGLMATGPFIAMAQTNKRTSSTGFHAGSSYYSGTSYSRTQGASGSANDFGSRTGNNTEYYQGGYYSYGYYGYYGKY